MISSKEFRFGNHLDNWKNLKKHIKRVILTTLIFGFVILLRVLIPLQNETINTEKNLEKLTASKDSMQYIYDISLKLDTTFKEIKIYISKRPWEIEKEKLIRKYGRIRELGISSNTQAVADSTINTIANNLNQFIIKPIESILKTNTFITKQFAGLNEKLTRFSTFIKNWKNNSSGVNWYRTIQEKDIFMEQLTYDINYQTKTFSEGLTQRISKLKTNIGKLEKSIASIDNQKNDLLTELENELDDILPVFLKKIIRVNHMVQLYPSFMLVFALYSFVIIYLIMRHFNYVAKEINITDPDIKDTTTSSVWTISSRNVTENKYSLLIYLLYFAAIVFLSEYGFVIFQQWFKVSPDKLLLFNVEVIYTFIWISRILFFALIMILLFYWQLPRIKDDFHDYK